jgi:CRP-like cAMP-binding protein
MPSTPRFPDGRQNRLLAGLPSDVYAALAEELTPVDLDARHLLYEVGETIRSVHFPLTAVASLLTVLEDGSSVEAAITGNEGVIGLPLALGLDRDGTRAVIQVAGAALEMPADAFRTALTRQPALARVLGRFTQSLLLQMAQMAACNRLHPVEERCARWLLQVHDRVGSDTFPLTQDFLATMLGVRRPSVTIAVDLLHRAGLVEQGRGRITVLDRAGLEAAACECYRTLATAIDQLLGGEGAL